MQQPTPTFPDVFTKDDDRTSDEIAIFLRSESYGTTLKQLGVGIWRKISSNMPFSKPASTSISTSFEASFRLATRIRINLIRLGVAFPRDFQNAKLHHDDQQ